MSASELELSDGTSDLPPLNGTQPTVKDLVLGMSKVLGRVERDVENLVDLKSDIFKKVDDLIAEVRLHTEAVNKATLLIMQEFQQKLARQVPPEG